MILFRKVYTLFLMMLAMPIVLLVRLVCPFITIRFGCLCSQRIGHFIGNIDQYLCERDAGMHERTFDIFYYHVSISNYQIKKMWERTKGLHISPFINFTRVLNTLNRSLPGGKKHTIITSDIIDTQSLRAYSKPNLSFTVEEECFGRQELQRLGIGSPFICFHARDSAYLDIVYPNHNWHYHDFRDSSIHNYIPAAEELTCRGYFAIRMGSVVKEALKTKNPKIIDYAVKGRTDFLDIYLGAKCRFFICDGCGVSSIPTVFRHPIVWVNHVQFKFIPDWGMQDLFIPKKLWLRNHHRFLTFSEIMDSDIKGFDKTEEYEKLGIELVENTPEEIMALALEMDERLKGTWQTTEEDKKLQKRFWLIVNKPDKGTRIGVEFLRQNRELLE